MNRRRLVITALLISTTGMMFATDSPEVKITATFPHTVILPKTVYNDALAVKVLASTEVAVTSFRATVATGDVELSADGPVAIGNGETKTITLRTKSPGYFVIKLEVLGEGGRPLTYEDETTKEERPISGATDYFVARVSEGYASGFMSDRVASDLFLGATFANEYDEEGKNGGFGSGAPVARLTFDTLWHPGIRQRKQTCDGCDAGKATREYTSSMAGLVHTGMEMQFADFPFGSVEGVDHVVERSDSFTGALYLLYQPDRLMASYTDTSNRPDKPWDAVRWGVLARAGFTTRLERKPSDADHDIARYALGLKMTHHQTAAPSALYETTNYLPMRFAEISAMWFEEWPTKDPQRPSNGEVRMVLDAGMRLPGAGSEVVPFYAGVHANVGRGPDDLRVFAGFVFQIDELVRLFQGAGQTGK